MPEGGGVGDRAGFAGSPVKTGLSGIPAAAGTEYNEKTRKIHTKTEKISKLVRTIFFAVVNVFSNARTCAKRAEKQENTTYGACKMYVQAV